MKIVTAQGTRIVEPNHFDKLAKMTKLASNIPAGKNAAPAGFEGAVRPKPARCIGDIRYVGGEDGIPYVAFRGGEGGRGWVVPSTKC